MIRLFLTIQILMLGAAGFAQQKRTDFLVSYTIKSKGNELMGYKTRAGKIVIPAQFIPDFGNDTLYERTFVVKPKAGLQGIDRTGKVILIPFIYDNGPDYMQEGFFRFVENSKIGFADENWKKVIPAVFDFVEPFKNGVAKYTLGGHKIMDGEHWYWSEGYENGYINRFNERFKKVHELKAGVREAWTNKEQHVLLDKKGKIVKVFVK